MSDVRPSPYWQAGGRTAALERLTEHWDLIVIGGGISGAGVLLEAARQGWRCLLVEQRDFAWGTSSRSSKLVHGGLRYLKEGQFRLTLHSVRERQKLLRDGEGLIEPQRFLFPDREGCRPPRWQLGIGLAVYDWMARTRTRRHHPLAEMQEMAPGLDTTGLRGGMSYLDAKTDDARLVLRVLQEAMQAGGLAINYLPAASLVVQDGQVIGLHLVDALTSTPYVVRAKSVISATGVWADRLRREVGGTAKLRPLRGSHLMIAAERLPVSAAVSFSHPFDGRPVFLYPWEGVTLVGTTDVDHAESLDSDAAITPEETAYLMAALHAQFPALALDYDDVLATYAGVRPVVDSGETDPSKAGREHIVLNENGLITLTGGKLTTFLPMAHDALALAAAQAGKPWQKPAGSVFSSPPRLPAGLSHLQRQRLGGRYGAITDTVLAAAKPQELELIPGTQTSWLELRWAARAEAVTRLEDLLLRRCRLGILLREGGLAHIARIRSICQPELGWDDARWESEESAYRELIARSYSLPPASHLLDWHTYLQPPAALAGDAETPPQN
ncbi:glycerol-3-phosphate dehydrogenase/oxidase [Parachitinimonas caeni]|uniref:Glycerol-3-phosphate dehydrogenase/oxidase n=1 Tax=Parachitinimonas caeni TaxID=3031301 RepID=A0ABT7E482_9NEIS|nr:glycerol-3-phosphate dehydrogenase/oxidase [Parachitinimonas caeni]MDK2126864.1 glycerol-3-phosphate dehydrogenase/oxidase [Parachitinimonas caeni]